MIKKIIFTIISLAILYFGYQSFNRLRFWDRSVQIFKMNSNQPFGRGGFDRGRGSFAPNGNGERTARPDFGNIPDSIRQQFAEQQRPEQPQTADRPQITDQPEMAEIPQMPNRPDNLRQQSRTAPPPNFRGRGGFDRGNLQRGGFPPRRNVRLNTVYRFLAVFAAFTVLTLYIDRGLKIRRKKRKLKGLKKETEA